MNVALFVPLLLAASLGGAIALILSWLYRSYRLCQTAHLAEAVIKNAEEEGERIQQEAVIKANQLLSQKKSDADDLWQTEKAKLQREEDRLKAREDRLEERLQIFEKKCNEVDRKAYALDSQEKQISKQLDEFSKRELSLQKNLEETANLSKEAAKDNLLKRLEAELASDRASLIEKSQKEAEEESERTATRIILTAIQRLSHGTVSDAAVQTVTLPNDDMKGRVIGREGRNIRMLESLTGVSVVIDDTPNIIVLSSFDPIRLHIAKTALQELVNSGRIHPSRIEECIEKAEQDIEKDIKRAGEAAAFDAGIVGLQPEITKTLGKLKFRFSLGQNVLNHSVEVAHIMRLIAQELGLDDHLAARIGLLHDIGKALSHEISGSHALVGHDLVLKYGESPEVANGVGCHHGEMSPQTLEASLCSSADALSASRPGARVESIEKYMRRLQHLERMALSFPGVEKAYAMQAGKEVRVLVRPEEIDDDGTRILARSLTKKIEEQLDYPGKIKITVIREKKAVEYAL